VVKLVGVDHGPDRLHHAIGDIKGQDADDSVGRVVGDRPGLAVDPRQFDAGAQARSLAGQPEHEPGHPLRAVEWPDGGPGLAAAIADHNHVGSEQLEQAGHVPARGRGEEPPGHLVALLA
jgi:hypothetical protein